MKNDYRKHVVICAIMLLAAHNAALAEPTPIDESNWGTMVALTTDIGKKDRIVSAELDGAGNVRVSGDNNVSTRILLEYHVFTKFSDTEKDEQRSYDKAYGPFIAIQPGSDNKVIQGIGAGIMLGLKGKGAQNNKVMTFALGVMADPNTKTLGDGITKNQTLPTGDTLRYKTTTKWSLLLGAGFTF